VPIERLRTVAHHAPVVVVAEENLSGQYRRIIEPSLAGKRVFGVTSLGRKITPQQIVDAIEEADWKAEYV
jgi:hypothetical protein